MSEKEFPSCAYDVCAEFDCEETMALALIATRNELDRTRKALDVAVDGIKYMRNNCLEYASDYMDKADEILEQITTLEQKEASNGTYRKRN